MVNRFISEWSERGYAKGETHAFGLDTAVFQQAKNYEDALEYSRRVHWIVTCNFQKFVFYDMEKCQLEIEPLRILLAKLSNKAYLLEFIVDHAKIKLREEENLISYCRQERS